MFRNRFSLLLLFILATFASLSIQAQEVQDTIKIKTRVVFLDALVKDKKTNLPISNLASDNFQVLDDGKPRNISYFTREGQARKPLALILILDLREDGAGRFLKREEILKSMENELAKLPPGDEVAILALDLFAIWGSAGFLEISVNGGSAAKLLGVRRGDEVSLTGLQDLQD